MSIRLENVSKWFGENLVVNDISLEVASGELFVLLGASGSGKSTILRLVSGLLHPDSGRIFLHGRDVTALPPQARNTGFVFQNYSVFRHMTVSKNVEFGLRVRSIQSRERNRRALALLDLVGLAGLGERYPDQLSGGQQQRVALARALAYEPEVLLLDEPFGALDARIRVQLRSSLKEIHATLGVTTVLVTHDQEEAFELADRIGVIERGQLVEIGGPDVLYHRPRSEFTATFVGGGNVLVGRRDGDAIRLGSIRLPMPHDAPAHEEDAPVRVLFRPETVVLAGEPFSTETAVQPIGRGTVRQIVFSGATQRVVVESEDLRGARPLAPELDYGERTTRVEAVRVSDPETALPFVPGRQVWIGLSEFHVLDPSGLKVLVSAEDRSEAAGAIEFGSVVAHAAGGPVTFVSVVESAALVDTEHEQLERLCRQRRSGLPMLAGRVRHGRLIEEILREFHEGTYEVIVLNRPPRSKRGVSEPWRTFVRALAPVLLVGRPRAEIRSMLICTAAGEPGKRDVRFGGRLARRAGAAVTVLHVLQGGTPDERERAERHLEQARASLEVLGVPAEALLEPPGTLVERVVREANERDVDLIVVGAPGTPERLASTDLADEISRGTDRPIMVVPMVP